MEPAQILIILLCVIIIALLLVLIKKSNNSKSETKTFELSQKIDILNKQIGDEFQRNRSDFSQFQTLIRTDNAKLVNELSAKLSEMNKENYEYRLQLTQTLTNSLNQIRDRNAEQNEKQTRTIDAAIGKMQENNEKKLEQMRLTVDEKLTSTLTTRLDSSFKTVSEQLENVYKSLGEMKELSSGVTDNVTTLNRVLTNVKARGTWAEVQLEAILDQTIPNMYVKNYQSSNNQDRVEFAIKIPVGEDSSKIIYLPIDSKFPMEDYIRLCDAADKANTKLLATARKALGDAVLKAAKDISKYIDVPYTTPFAIMYLATEGLYAEIAASKTGLLEKLQHDFNIMVAGPSTITALLNSLSMGFKTVAINEKANEIRKILAAAKSQYELFGTVLEKAKRKIEEAGKSLDDAQNRNRIIQKHLKGVETLNTSNASKVLGINDEENVEYEK